MDEPETGRTGPAAPDAECPLDGTINFTGYSDRQLSELRFTIHRERFPKNFATLQAEIDRRARAEIAPGLETELVAGRLSRHDGLRGWLESKLTRSPLYGLGSMEFMQNQLVLNGWRRTWLGTPLQGQLVVSTNRIRNVVRDGDTVRFELTNSYWPVKRIAFRPEEQLHTASIVARLPSTRAQGFERRWESVRDFNERLRNVSQRPVVTPTLVAANMLIFAVMCVAGKDLGRFTLTELVTWGDNAGPLTVNGQWWRLVTAPFLHVSLPHLLLNMWALWNIGRLCEQVFGRWTFALLYFATGVLGGLTSIAWNPDVNSAGASGAIFGALGAFLAFFLNPGNRVPATIARRHWIGTSLFVVFNLVSGAMQTGIDNAAHVGGLVEGFALGWILARPLEMRRRPPPCLHPGAHEG
jgi:rhomboid protease GluP